MCLNHCISTRSTNNGSEVQLGFGSYNDLEEDWGKNFLERFKSSSIFERDCLNFSFQSKLSSNNTLLCLSLGEVELAVLVDILLDFLEVDG